MTLAPFVLMLGLVGQAPASPASTAEAPTPQTAAKTAPPEQPARAGYTQAEAQALFVEATEAYTAGAFDTAVDKLERLVRAGFGDGAVLYNLGTVHLATGRLGPAVLWLERARRVDRSADVESNLAVARERQLDKVVGADESTPFVERVAAAVDEALVTPAFLVAWLSTFVLLVLVLRAPAGGRTVLGLGLAGALCVSLALGGAVAAHAWARLRVVDAVVLADTAPVRELPSDGARVSFEVHAGLRLRLVDESGRFARVRLANALEGWLDRAAVEPVDAELARHP